MSLGKKKIEKVKDRLYFWMDERKKLEELIKNAKASENFIAKMALPSLETRLNLIQTIITEITEVLYIIQEK